MSAMQCQSEVYYDSIHVEYHVQFKLPVIRLDID